MALIVSLKNEIEDTKVLIMKYFSKYSKINLEMQSSKSVLVSIDKSGN
jgi:hypothetical protein